MSEVQTTEDEVKDQKSALADLVNSSLEKDYNKANEIFNDEMTVRLSDVLDQAKVKLAGQIYNGDPEDEELIDDDYPRAEEIDDDEYAPDNEESGDDDADADAEGENEDDEEETEQLDSEEAEAEGDDDGSEPDEDEDEIEGAAV